MITRLKKKIYQYLHKDLFRNTNKNDVLPEIYEKQHHEKGSLITHISAFSYGNAGDTLLPIALHDTFENLSKEIIWKNQHSRPVVDEKIVHEINLSKGVVIGGGGLFLKDTNPNKISGWQWPCSIEMLEKIKVPIVLYAVGYNRFRGQDDFEPYFRSNITAFAKKAEFIGIRNTGSIKALKNYIPENLHHKLRFQPCMTTHLSLLYPELTDYDNKENFIAVNAAFDRSHLRFGENIGNILNQTAKVLKEFSKEIPIKFYSHMITDEAFLPFLQSHNIPFEIIKLNNVHPKEIIKAYAKPKLVVGMRGHAQMIPFGCNTPIVSIISHDKMQWFLDDIGQPKWGADVLSENYEEDLRTSIRNSLNETNTQIEYIKNKQKELYSISINNAKDALTLMSIIK